MTTHDMSNENEAASASGAEQLTTPPDSAPVNEPAAESQRNRLIPILQVSAALVVSIAVVVILIRYASFVEGLGEWGYAGVFLLQLINSATVVLLPVPGHAVIFAVSGTLNPLLIGLVGAIGAALGEMTAYMAGRGGSSMVDGSKWYKRLETMGTRWRGLAIFAFAATPLPFDIAGIWAGAIRYPIARFLVIVFAGKLILVTAIAIAGYYGVDFLEGLPVIGDVLF